MPVRLRRIQCGAPPFGGRQVPFGIVRVGGVSAIIPADISRRVFRLRLVGPEGRPLCGTATVPSSFIS
jgi:hypothetical protein